MTPTARFALACVVALPWSATAAPEAVAVASSNAINCAAWVTFDGSDSRPEAEGDEYALVEFAWDFDGDGMFETAGQSVRRHLGRIGPDGRYVATLRVTDARGESDTASVGVELRPVEAPEPDPGGPYDTAPRADGAIAPVLLDGSRSRDRSEPCDDVVRWAWDLNGDRRADVEGERVAAVGAAWAVGGRYGVSLQACDIAGRCSPWAPTTVEVLPQGRPAAEILEPAPGAWICADGFTLRLRVSDLEGDPVALVGRVGDAPVVRAVLPTVVGGAASEVALQANLDGIPDGALAFEFELDDAHGGRRVVPLPLNVDRTPPEILRDGHRDFCYIDFPGDDRPSESSTTDNMRLDPVRTVGMDSPDGCVRSSFFVRARDACRNTAEFWSHPVDGPVRVAIFEPQDGAVVERVVPRWGLTDRLACDRFLSAEVSRAGGPPVPLAPGAEIDEPGEYALRVTAPVCPGDDAEAVVRFRISGPPKTVEDAASADAAPDADAAAPEDDAAAPDADATAPVDGVDASEASPPRLDAAADADPGSDLVIHRGAEGCGCGAVGSPPGPFLLVSLGAWVRRRSRPRGGSARRAAR